MKTHVYVDGFNLYYGALRGSGFKWLDLAAMCRLLLPGDDIRRIEYFTARVNGRPADPDQPQRQLLYLRALSTIPNVHIVYGHFLTKRVTMPLAGGPPGARQTARVIKTEEKGSDVNLAAHLLWDGFREQYEAAVLEHDAAAPRDLHETDPQGRAGGEPVPGGAARRTRAVYQAGVVVSDALPPALPPHHPPHHRMRLHRPRRGESGSREDRVEHSLTRAARRQGSQHD